MTGSQTARDKLGGQKGKRANRQFTAGVRTAKVSQRIAEWFWESQPERVKAPYAKS